MTNIEEIHQLLKTGTNEDVREGLRLSAHQRNNLLNRLISLEDTASLDRLNSGMCGWTQAAIFESSSSLYLMILKYSAISVLSWWAGHEATSLEHSFNRHLNTLIEESKLDVLEWFRLRSSLTVNKFNLPSERLWMLALEKAKWDVIKWLEGKNIPLPSTSDGLEIAIMVGGYEVIEYIERLGIYPKQTTNRFRSVRGEHRPCSP